jgi:hypothetical protein
MPETVEIDTETARLIEQVARLGHTDAGVVVKDAVAAPAKAAGLGGAAVAQAIESAAEWVRRTIAILDTLPERPEDDRSINEIIGYDENGMP